MRIFKNPARRALAVLAAGVLSSAAQAAITTQLGLLIDDSGSISNADFNTLKSGFAAAILGIPTDGSVELTVFKFASVTTQVIAPTVVTAGNINTLSTTVGTMAHVGGSTYTAAGITAITNALVGSGNYSAGLSSIVNITTDGVPNDGTGNPQQNAINAATASKAAGIDALTAEYLGSGSVNFLQSLVFSPLAGPSAGGGTVLAANSTIIPNPMTSNAWVVPVTTYTAFASVIDAKIQAVVHPTPEPGSMLLVGIAIAGLAASRRRQA